MNSNGGEVAGQSETGVNWGAVGMAAVPPVVVLGAVFALAHQFDLQTVCTRYAEAPSPETLPPSGLWMTATAAGGAGLAAAIPRMLKWRLVAGAVALVSVLILGLLPPPCLAVGFLAPLAVFAMAVRNRIQGEPVRTDLVAGGLLMLILSYASWLRYGELLTMLPNPLDPDGFGYLEIAEKDRGWSTRFREPLYIWILQICHLLGGTYGGPFLRLVGVGSSLLSISVVFALCWRRIGRSAALVASGFYAAMPFMVFTAVRGLRENLIIATTFLFLWACLNVWGKMPTLRGYVVLGLAGAAAVMLRLSSLNFVAVMTAITFGFAVWKHRPPLKKAAVILAPAAIVGGLLIPYLVHCKNVYNDAFYAVNFSVRFYANVELAGKHPDMPTPEEVAADSYAGPPITPGEYLFKYHTLSQVVTGTLRGIKRLCYGDLIAIAYLRDEKGTAYPLFNLLQLAALAAFLLPGRRLILAGLFWFHTPMFFLTSFHWFDPRLLTVAFAGYYVGAGAAVATAVSLAHRLLFGKDEPEVSGKSPRRKERKPSRRNRAGVKSHRGN